MFLKWDYYWDMTEKKSGRGGRREGAGRKKIPESERKKFRTVSISGTENEIAVLKKQAAENGKSLSGYILDELVDESVRGK